MRSNDTYHVSRRKVLAGLGTVGVASAGAGLGTTAFFSDVETFTNNKLTAGTLDLKVDWQEHYSDWSEDEAEGLQYPIHMEDPMDPDYVGLPHPDEPLIWVHKYDLDQFMENTSIEAYPDGGVYYGTANDGQRDPILDRTVIAGKVSYATAAEIDKLYAEQFANLPEDLDPDGLRTDNDDTRDPETGETLPLINLDDVKPGDFGEVTFSLHIFDNPAYVWLTGELVDADEGMYSEPEEKDPDEIGPGEADPLGRILFENEGNESNEPSDDPADTVKEVVELLDEIRVVIWHDDSDNVLEDEERVEAPHNIGTSGNILLDKEEAIIFDGYLREALRLLSSGSGIPLDANPKTDKRDCFDNSTTRYVGFAWWLPVDHANEIQTDSVMFDLGFYIEQCRHNDGSGIDS